MANSPSSTPSHLLTNTTMHGPHSRAQRQRHNHSPGLRNGSATQTLTTTSSSSIPQREGSPDEPLVLRLRGAHSPTISSDSAAEDGDNDGRLQQRRRKPARIQWAEDVIDNEGLGRKKSKVCCIYHKPRPVGESSDESSSDSSDSSDSDSDLDVRRDGARPVSGGGAKGGRGRRNGHDHNSNGSGDDCGHTHGKGGSPEETQGRRQQRRRPSPNAYEKMPKYNVQPLTQQPGGTK